MSKNNKTDKVKITQAKGRPMLHWVGKRPLTNITAFPAQHIETFDPTGSCDIETNKLFHGDNKEVLAYLLVNGYRGKINLIYIDPPFDSGADYVRKVSLRGEKGQAKIEGENYTLGEQIQYTDIWANDNYLQFMYERLLLLKELLAESGSIYLHCAWHKNHHLRCLMDEVFGMENFNNEVIWYYPDNFQGNVSGFATNHNNLLWYAKGQEFTANKVFVKLSKPKKRDVRIWSKEEGKLVAARDKNGDIIYETFTQKKIDDVWVIGQSSTTKERSKEYLGYPTQKPEQVLERVIMSGTNLGDVVLDCFIGSGTTAAVAQKLGLRWIGCDINKGAIQTTSKRLQKIILGQIEEQQEKAKRPKLIEDNEEIKPASVAFSVYRVNDYDLQIQHNEAVNLACEHIGIERKKTDTFFDGILGKNLVKIIPFTHPLSPVDLEEIKKELEARPEEDRTITVVCLGMELAAKAWIEEWNRLRKGKNAVNKIDVIELRTDAKYGGFIKHEPAKAKINFTRKKDMVAIEVEDFISPTIIQRLQQQAGLLQLKINDWRSMVDCIMIDSDYDGRIFNIKLSDVPEKKTDLVAGKYTLENIKAKATIAVKIIDMLGEEVLVVKENRP